MKQNSAAEINTDLEAEETETEFDLEDFFGCDGDYTLSDALDDWSGAWD